MISTSSILLQLSTQTLYKVWYLVCQWPPQLADYNLTRASTYFIRIHTPVLRAALITEHVLCKHLSKE